MMRPKTILPGLLILALAWCAAPAAIDPAVACEDARAVALAAAEETTPRPPRPPRVPRPPRTPRTGTPEPAEAPEPPEPGMFGVPEAPSLITPRGWFGFGFQCEDCAGRLATDDSTAVWEFGSHPRVYSVDVGGPASRAGLRRGDVITGIDGVSILTPEGGRRFGAIRPGQLVKWKVLRGDQEREVVARAAERPERRVRTALTDLRRELTRISELADLDEQRRELAVLNREMERRRAQELTREAVRVRTTTARRLRYAGVIGGTEVEVRGPGSIIVSETQGNDELVITTGESVVVIRVPEAARKRAKETPK